MLQESRVGCWRAAEVARCGGSWARTGNRVGGEGIETKLRRRPWAHTPSHLAIASVAFGRQLETAVASFVRKEQANKTRPASCLHAESEDLRRR